MKWIDPDCLYRQPGSFLCAQHGRLLVGESPLWEKLKQIWLQPDYDSAKKYAISLMDEYETRYPQAIETLEEGLEDSL